MTFRCKYSEKCDLYTNGRCVNDPIEYGKPYNLEDILECKLTDLKETSENLGIDPTYKQDNKLKKEILQAINSQECLKSFSIEVKE